MNYCTECKSLYAKPGTCNCYAAVAKPAPLPIPMPWAPYVPTQTPPVQPYTPWWGTVTVAAIDCGAVLRNATIS